MFQRGDRFKVNKEDLIAERADETSEKNDTAFRQVEMREKAARCN